MIMSIREKIYEPYKMGIVKQIDIKNRTYFFYNNIIDFKNFDARLLKIYKKNHTKTLVFPTWGILHLKN